MKVVLSRDPFGYWHWNWVEEIGFPNEYRAKMVLDSNSISRHLDLVNWSIKLDILYVVLRLPFGRWATPLHVPTKLYTPSVSKPHSLNTHKSIGRWDQLKHSSVSLCAASSQSLHPLVSSSPFMPHLCRNTHQRAHGISTCLWASPLKRVGKPEPSIVASSTACLLRARQAPWPLCKLSSASQILDNTKLCRTVLGTCCVVKVPCGLVSQILRSNSKTSKLSGIEDIQFQFPSSKLNTSIQTRDKSFVKARVHIQTKWCCFGQSFSLD